MNRKLLLAILLLPSTSLFADLPEPGPESHGMRLRFIVLSERKGTNDSHQVRIDLISVTNKPIKLIADWPGESEGGFKEYLESDVSITTDPPIMPFMGQVGVGRRTRPQPEYTLSPGETLTVQWTNSGRRLKTKEIHYFQTHNPTFPTDGLYSVRASLLLRAAETETEKKLSAEEFTNALARSIRRNAGLAESDEDSWKDFMKACADSNPHGTVLLRSNEQLVPIGGSHALPKSPLGKIVGADTNTWTATIDLGQANKIEIGDQFQTITHLIGEVWKLTITNVDRTWSQGFLQPITGHGWMIDSSVLRPGAQAELILKTDPRYRD